MATWIGLVVLVLAVLVWSPFTVGSLIIVIIVILVILVVVGVEAIRRTSLAEQATLLEAEAATSPRPLKPVGAAASADSGGDTDESA